MRLWLDRMNEIWKLDGVLNEEDRNVVADYIPITLLGVEFDGKPSNITNGIL